MEEKQRIREQMKARLHELTVEEKRAYEEQMVRNLYALPLWQEAQTVALTIAKRHEINTIPMIENAWQTGKTVCVPKCDPATKTMTFRAIRSFAQLETVYFGLQEPIEALTDEVKPAAIDLMVVPGICFSKDGYRIGYGGGYYDRYLQQVKKPTISLAYAFQVVDHLPTEPHDLPVDIIITNEKVIVCHE
ncbi:5-formyltetrahydrofolate cyclo-ligase [Anoxybacillus sp. J5B_2022]|uniref:5-formyltetrahydrofolate cyclo-ligase n=1 Tax=Anoxybacillus sp. J5B_2022 TaxID=3003246 RepID=UPI002285651E|nr:5-formyltetrahydrofolate cyclo-ligase [Anoxybacillus sp. J5B_2022]MCZ0754619.1 5-formyltetrahydrofolate cyclo-ligase [Anoxybacillus sp. J5B_2022]